jgi:hypothetical protein
MLRAVRGVFAELGCARLMRRLNTIRMVLTVPFMDDCTDRGAAEPEESVRRYRERRRLQRLTLA